MNSHLPVRACSPSALSMRNEYSRADKARRSARFSLSTFGRFQLEITSWTASSSIARHALLPQEGKPTTNGTTGPSHERVFITIRVEIYLNVVREGLAVWKKIFIFRKVCARYKKEGELKERSRKLCRHQSDNGERERRG